jgi:hypothetical protein
MAKQREKNINELYKEMLEVSKAVGALRKKIRALNEKADGFKKELETLLKVMFAKDESLCKHKDFALVEEKRNKVLNKLQNGIDNKTRPDRGKKMGSK